MMMVVMMIYKKVHQRLLAGPSGTLGTQPSNPNGLNTSFAALSTEGDDDGFMNWNLLRYIALHFIGKGCSSPL